MSVSDALATSKALRVPRFAGGVSPQAQIRELESYLLESAFVQGELSEERLDTLVALKELNHRWDHLDGWQTYRRSRTEAGVDDAKRQLQPELYDQKRDLEWTVRRLTEEIERLERDAAKVSRAYSMLSGS